MELLRFYFTIVHRPEKMLTECNMLSRYNTWTSKWDRETTADKLKSNKQSTPVKVKTVTKAITTYAQEIEEIRRAGPVGPYEELRETVRVLTNPIPVSVTNRTVKIVGPKDAEQTDWAASLDTRRIIWMMGSGASMVEKAATQVGVVPAVMKQLDENPDWQAREDVPDAKTLLARIARGENKNEKSAVNWLIIQQHG